MVEGKGDDDKEGWYITWTPRGRTGTRGRGSRKRKEWVLRTHRLTAVDADDDDTANPVTHPCSYTDDEGREEQEGEISLTHARTQTHTHTHTAPYTHTRTHARTHAHTHAHTHIRTHEFTPTHHATRTHINGEPLNYTRVRAYTHTHTQLYTHTNANTHV